MNRINQLFQDKKENILSMFITAGFPQKDSLVSVLKKMEECGVDLVEIGMPYSDPLADGPTIQGTNSIALENGMTLELLFEQLKDIRQQVNIPLILMGYVNPVLQFGMENFCEKAAEVGIDGMILPDLPLKEFEKEYKELFDKHGLKNIFLITPQTSEERIRQIDDISDAFLYQVSTASTTGSHKGIEGSQDYFERIQGMDLKNPTVIGFNVKDQSSFEFACRYANGAIIASAFLKRIQEEDKELSQVVEEFVQGVRPLVSN